MTEEESAHTRREMIASGGIVALGTTGIAGYLGFVHEPAPPLDVEITEGSEYVTGVELPENNSPLFSKWNPPAFTIEVSDTLNADNVAFKLSRDGVSVGWYMVKDLPGCKEVDFRGTLQERAGEYTVTLYGVPDPSKWGGENKPPNGEPDAEASFTISRPEER